MNETFDVDAFFAELGRQVQRHRDQFSHPRTVAVRLAEGQSFLIDTSRAEVLSYDWSPDADAVILANIPTLQALAQGTLDVASPDPGQVCVCSGSMEALMEL